jgi:hypothetical protein
MEQQYLLSNKSLWDLARTASVPHCHQNVVEILFPAQAQCLLLAALERHIKNKKYYEKEKYVS